MSQPTLNGKVKPVKMVHVAAQVPAAAQVTAGIDTLGYDHVAFLLTTGTMAAGATLAVKIQESDTSGGTYADVDGAVFTGLVDTDDDVARFGEVWTRRTKRWLRVHWTSAVGNVGFNVTALLHNAGPDGAYPTATPLTPAADFAA